MSVVLIHQEEPEPMLQADFSDFWALYPRRVAKKDALIAWTKIPQSSHVEILTSLFEWRRIWQDRGEMDFVPYPATWLRGERWEDEYPSHHQPYRDRGAVPEKESSHSRDQPAKPMPAHVIAALKKLRAK